MRYAIASDIHGSAHWCRRLLALSAEEEVEGLILLGDLMYHGPRNALPDGYDPAEVARMLNGFEGSVVAVRGNCDAEVDQMLLDFPCMGDYAVVEDGPQQMLCTHGHLDTGAFLAAAPDASVVLSGHTHVKCDEVRDGIRYLNPGSVSIPKDGSHSCLIYGDGCFDFRVLG